MGEKAVNTKTKSRYFDYSLLVIMLFLVVFGLVMIYSTSYYSGLKNGDAAFFLKKQLKSTIVFGIPVFILCTFIVDYKFYYKLAPYIYIVSILCVVLVKSPLGMTINGASRWIKLGPLSFQPAELCKLALIIAVSSYMVFVTEKKFGSFVGTVCFWLLVLFPTVLILFLTKNLSSAVIVFGIGFCMYFIASKRIVPFVLLAVAAVAGYVAFRMYVYYKVDPVTSGMALDEEASFRMVRVLAWLHPEDYSSSKSYQTLQSLYALGSGGIFGKGLGQSIQKLGFIPEAQNDMIFAVVCEELGLFGGVSLIILFALMIYRFMVIALNAPDLMGAMIAVGVASHIAIQVILNVAVVTNLVPNTGISLPFISYGGTSVLFLIAEIGIVLNVSRHIKYK